MVVLATSTRLDVDDVLRIRWAELPTDSTTLVLRQNNTEKTVSLNGEAADLSGLDLSQGTWSVHISGHEIVTTDPGFSLGGLADYARRPRTRAIHVFRERSGGLRLAIRAAEPYAEVTAVHPNEDRTVIEGYFAFGNAPANAGITAIRRKTKDMAIGNVSVTGDRWRAELPDEPFALEDDRGFWDLRLGGLRVAALLDDIPQKKAKVRFPARNIEGRVRPYYTKNDHLAIATTIIMNAEAS